MTDAQSMKTAPRDGTRFLAYWPAVMGEDNAGWVTTWWGVNAAGFGGWESPWEYADTYNEPTHWMPQPDVPK